MTAAMTTAASNTETRTVPRDSVCIIRFILHVIPWGRHYDCSSGTHEEIGVAKDTSMPQPAGTEQELG